MWLFITKYHISRHELDTPVLKHPQVELFNYGHYVVENIGLYILVVDPILDAGKEVEFKCNALFCGLQLADHAGHFVVDFGMVFQVGLYVCAEHPYVCLAAAVHQNGVVGFVFAVEFLNLFFGLFYVLFKVLDFTEAF